MSVYVTIEPIEEWSLNDLRVFYRILRWIKAAKVENDEDEERFAQEDYETPIAKYRFVMKNSHQAIDFEHMLVHLIGGFSYTCDDEPDEEFQAWLDQKKKNRLKYQDLDDKSGYSSNENRVKNTLLNEERSDLNGGKTQD